MIGNSEVKIDFMIIGVEKAGTTALLRHLAQSPRIFIHEQREMFYFLSDYEFQRGWHYATEKYFSGYNDGLVLAKNVMQINSRVAMERLKKQCPDVKCIVMLREPAARAYSAFNYARLRGAEDCKTFEEALDLEDDRFRKDHGMKNPLLYLRNSTYAPRLSTAFEVYGRDQVLVIFHEEYKKDPVSQLTKIENFIGKNLFDGIERELGWHNRAAKARYPWLSKWTYRFLKSHSPVKKTLRALIPHGKAVKLRHAVLNFNRIEAPYEPMQQDTAQKLRKKLESDRQAIIQMLGYCPW